MAYCRELTRPRCGVCGGLAQVEVFNRFNASLGAFCRRHGEMRRRDVQRGEEGSTRSYYVGAVSPGPGPVGERRRRA